MGARLVLELDAETYAAWRARRPPLATRLLEVEVRLAGSEQATVCEPAYVEPLAPAVANHLGIPDGPGAAIRLHTRRKEDARGVDRSPHP